MCCRVERNGTKYMLTARHLFTSSGSGCDTDDVRGMSAYQNGDYYGTVEDHFTEHDAVITKLDSGGSRDSTSRTIVNQSGGICGHLTYNGLDYYASNNETIQFRGCHSGTLTPDIKSYNNSVTCDTNIVLTEQVYLDANTSGGDSGGIHYEDSSGEQYVSNIHSGELSSGEAFGAAAAGMNEYDNLTFDTSSSLSC